MAADSVMDDLQAEPAAVVLTLSDRLAEAVRPQLMISKNPGLVAAARGLLPSVDRRLCDMSAIYGRYVTILAITVHRAPRSRA